MWKKAAESTFILLITVMANSTARAFLMITQLSRRQAMGSALLSLSVASKTSFEDGHVTVSRDESDKFSLYYRMYSKDEPSIPLLVVHGGPYVSAGSCCWRLLVLVLTVLTYLLTGRSLPSQYLYPIVDNVDNRPILFYDQLGCGKSDEPKQKK